MGVLVTQAVDSLARIRRNAYFQDMNFIKRLFNRLPKETVECPRCLGKGNVDQGDIKRLGQELRWRPGKCAYCKGAGRVDVSLIGRVSPDEAYLTVNMPTGERELLFAGDPRAMQRKEKSKAEFEMFITKIRALHFEQNHSAEEIAKILMGSYMIAPRGFNVQEYRREFISYIKSVIYEAD
jgi:hypothetical protein